MKRIFLVHGWGGSSEKDWLPWAIKELNKKGYEAVAPVMPDTEHPKIEPWVNKLKQEVGGLRSDDIFVGHSIGCQTILRYLEKIEGNEKADKVILIAPWWHLTLSENEEQADIEPWYEVNVDFEKINSKANKFIAVFSDNDPWVPFGKNSEFFKKNLNPEIIVKKSMGHFTEDEGVDKIEFLLELIK